MTSCPLYFRTIHVFLGIELDEYLLWFDPLIEFSDEGQSKGTTILAKDGKGSYLADRTLLVMPALSSWRMCLESPTTRMTVSL